MRLEPRRLVAGALLAFVAVTGAMLAVKETRRSRALAAAEAGRGPVREPGSAAPTPVRAAVVVTYFHTTARCVSCLKIEDLTDATMTTRFAGPLAEKRVLWRSLNLDDPANAHFAKDYGLYTKSVIVSEVRGGREVRWKNLDQVWNLLGDPAAFQAYVEREVQAFLEPA